MTLPLVGDGRGAPGVSRSRSRAVGLAVGFWVRDPVRGLLAALGVWFALLFGTDLLLLAVSGAPWVHERPGLWVALLMGNPLDAFRITVLFSVEQAAFAGLDAGGLVRWWLAHGWVWLTLLVCCGPPAASSSDSPARGVVWMPEAHASGRYGSTAPGAPIHRVDLKSLLIRF